MKLLADKTALITGAARGIGAAVALEFAKHGANIAFTDIAESDNANNLVTELEGHGVKAKFYVSDASSFESSEETVNQILEDFGQIDVLINNAGITRDNLLLRMGPDDWDLVMNINLKSAFNLTKNVIRAMMKARSGSIVNMSSVVGVGGNAGQANYSASKAGMIGFTKSVARELGSRNIRCNAIAPGFIRSEMTDSLSDEVKEGFIKQIPLARYGNPDEVAGACLFLASDLSSYVSGQVINVCGAMQT